MESEIYQLIPHRPPFLWVDKILSLTADSIEAEKFLPVDLEICQGHYPDYPIIPGVILCEAVFQAGALLIAGIMRKEVGRYEGVPVLTRIYGARFKRQVHPGMAITLQARLTEKVGAAWLLKGKVLVEGRTAVSVEFACILAPQQGRGG